MASRSAEGTSPGVTPPSAQGKRRRRPATGRAEAYRKQWGHEWGQFAKQESEKLRAETEGA